MASETGYDEALWQTLCEQIGVAALASRRSTTAPGSRSSSRWSCSRRSAARWRRLPCWLAGRPRRRCWPAATRRPRRGCSPGSRRARSRRSSTGSPRCTPTRRRSSSPRRTTASRAGPAPSDPKWLPSMDQTIRLGVTRRVRRRPGSATATPPGRRAELVGAVGVAALAAGLAARALDMTVAYSKERVQFGRPIGSFQALKHRMADMLVLVEMCRSASWAASYAVATHADDAERARPRREGLLLRRARARSPPRPCSCTAASRSPGSTTPSWSSSAPTRWPAVRRSARAPGADRAVVVTTGSSSGVACAPGCVSEWHAGVMRTTGTVREWHDDEGWEVTTPRTLPAVAGRTSPSQGAGAKPLPVRRASDGNAARSVPGVQDARRTSGGDH